MPILYHCLIYLSITGYAQRVKKPLIRGPQECRVVGKGLNRDRYYQRTSFLSVMSLLGLEDGDEATYTDIAEAIRSHSSEPTKDLHELMRYKIYAAQNGSRADTRTTPHTPCSIASPVFFEPISA